MFINDFQVPCQSTYLACRTASGESKSDSLPVGLLTSFAVASKEIKDRVRRDAP